MWQKPTFNSPLFPLLNLVQISPLRHSSYCFPAFLLLITVRRGWSMPFGSWKWCPTRGVLARCTSHIEALSYLADIAIVLVHLLNISVYNLESYELIIGRGTSCDEEEGSVTSVNDLRIWQPCISNCSWSEYTSSNLYTPGSCTFSFVWPEPIVTHPWWSSPSP